MVIGFTIGILFLSLIFLRWKHKPIQLSEDITLQKAIELPTLRKTEDVEAYIKNVCYHCTYYDNICCRREHWGEITQNTIEWCKRRKAMEVLGIIK